MMEERGVEIDHTTIYRWVQYYAPKILDKLKWYWKQNYSTTWYVDETYIKVKVRLAQVAMKNKETSISELCQELGEITKQTLYRYVSPDGELRKYGKKVLEG